MLHGLSQHISPSTVGLWMVHDLIDARTRRDANITNAKFWHRQVVVVAEDIDKDTLSVLTSEMLEKPL